MTSSDLLKLEGSAVAKPTQAGSGYVMIIPSQEGLKKEESREGETLDEIPGANAELFDLVVRNQFLYIRR
ncbi:hypothetical protein FOBRF1_002134 [Fusarium oxysporum]